MVLCDDLVPSGNLYSSLTWARAGGAARARSTRAGRKARHVMDTLLRKTEGAAGLPRQPLMSDVDDHTIETPAIGVAAKDVQGQLSDTGIIRDRGPSSNRLVPARASSGHV